MPYANYEDQLNHSAAQGKTRTAKAIDIGELPDVKFERLLKVCERDLLRFLVKAFPNTTGLKEFSDEQKQAIANIQRGILEGGWTCQALPRGFAKTAITTRAALWAMLYGHCEFVVIYAANKTLSESILASMKLELQVNEQLMGMFPAICYPILKLGGRTKKQTYRGETTEIEWKHDTLTFPTMPDCPGSAAVVQVKAMNSARGAHKTTKDLKVVRPDLLLFDDIQTDEDAENQNTVRKICDRVQTAVMGGGHFDDLTAIMSITVIDDDDVAEVHLSDPAWVSVRYKMMRSLPKDYDTEGPLWREYFAIRRGFVKHDAESRARAIQAATDFYAANREAMDLGAEATWIHCHKKNELSAVQHAMNILCDSGLNKFLHECQNQTRENDQERNGSELTWKDVLTKTIPLARGVCPNDTQTLTCHIDVHESVLSYKIVAFNGFFGAHVPKYGVFPEQSTKNFLFRKARKTVVDIAPKGADMDAAIYHALSSLIDEIMATEFMTQVGGVVRVSAIGVDTGFRSKPVKDVVRNHRFGALIHPMKGKGIKVKDRKISEWRTNAASKKGDEWIYGRPEKGDLKQFTFDSNYWKSKTAEAVLAPIGTSFGLTWHEGDVSDHQMMAQQMAAERPTTLRLDDGSSGEEWTLPTAKPDNHFFDNAVGAFVLASYLGIERGETYQRKRSSKRRKARTL